MMWTNPYYYYIQYVMHTAICVITTALVPTTFVTML